MLSSEVAESDFLSPLELYGDFRFIKCFASSSELSGDFRFIIILVVTGVTGVELEFESINE